LIEDGHPSRIALVAELNSPMMLEQLAAYVHEDARLRALVRRPADDSELDADRHGRECVQFTDIQDADEQVQIVWGGLLGSGVLSKDDAVRTAADYLREAGQADFRRLDSSGPLYAAVLDAIERGVRFGCVARPRRGFVRAVLPWAQYYDNWLWQTCVLAVLEEVPMSRDDVIRRAAAWAVENVGLAHQRLRKGGKVDQGLRRALTRVIRQGSALKEGPNLVRLANQP
jgi:hypothetical protein